MTEPFTCMFCDIDQLEPRLRPFLYLLLGDFVSQCVNVPWQTMTCHHHAVESVAALKLVPELLRLDASGPLRPAIVKMLAEIEVAVMEKYEAMESESDEAAERK